MADRRLRRHLSHDEMNMGIGMLHSGLSQRHVANVLGVSQSVVSRMWNRLWTLPIDVLGYGECQMSVLLQFVWQNMIGLAGLSHGLGGNKCSGENGPPRH